MSLVGPRMITAEEGDEYGRLKLNLLTVKPGITGLWQVSGRSDVSYEERVRLDMHYIRTYSICVMGDSLCADAARRAAQSRRLLSMKTATAPRRGAPVRRHCRFGVSTIF